MESDGGHGPYTSLPSNLLGSPRYKRTNTGQDRGRIGSLMWLSERQAAIAVEQSATGIDSADSIPLIHSKILIIGKTTARLALMFDWILDWTNTVYGLLPGSSTLTTNLRPPLYRPPSDCADKGWITSDVARPLPQRILSSKEMS